MSKRTEYRIFKTQIRAGKGGKPQIEGYAAVFNTETDLGYMREKIAPGAFTRAVTEKHDVRALFNHDPNNVLGRTESGTLKLTEDDKGLYFTCDMPDTQLGRDVHTLIKRGDVSQCSFGFIVRDEEMNYGGDVITRTIKDVDLFDVSPVTYPAYPTTSVEARSNEAVLAKYRDKDGDDGDEMPHDDPDPKDEHDYYEEMGNRNMDISSAHAEHAEYLRSAGYGAGLHEELSDNHYVMAQACYERAAACMGERSQERKAGKTKRVAGEDLPASAFAYVGDKDDTSTWKLPIKFSTEAKTKAHIRNALARFNQTQGIPEDKKAAVLAKIKAAAKECGIDVAETKSLNQARLRTRLAEISLTM